MASTIVFVVQLLGVRYRALEPLRSTTFVRIAPYQKNVSTDETPYHTRQASFLGQLLHVLLASAAEEIVPNHCTGGIRRVRRKAFLHSAFDVFYLVPGTALHRVALALFFLERSGFWGGMQSFLTIIHRPSDNVA